MTTFPLYDSLINTVPKKGLTIKQKTELAKNISALNQNGQELIYALIKYHTIKEKTVSDDIPYDGTASASTKKNCEDITWDITNLPSTLVLILHMFVQLHKKTQEEEVKRLKVLDQS